MGEKITTICSLLIKDTCFDVELNFSSCGDSQYEVHLQSKDFRAEFTESEFLEFTAAVRLASEKLRKSKSL